MKNVMASRITDQMRKHFVAVVSDGIFETDDGEWRGMNVFWCPDCPPFTGPDPDVQQGRTVHSMDVVPPSECPYCGGTNVEFFGGDSEYTFGGGCNYKTPIVSDSLAVNINQIEEHKQMFPDIEITDQGQPIFNNRRQHDKYLDEINMVKQPKKIKNLGKKTL